MFSRRNQEIVSSLDDISVAIQEANGPTDILAVNTTGEASNLEKLIDIAGLCRNKDQVVLIDPALHQWELRPTTYGSMGTDLSDMAKQVHSQEGSLIAVVPDINEVFDHTGHKRNRFATFGGNCAVKVCDGTSIATTRSQSIADYRALVPFSMGRMSQSSEPAQDLSQIIERDRRGGWFETGQYVGNGSTLESLVRVGSSVAEYCQRFGKVALIMAVQSNGYWVGMPAEIHGKPDANARSRYEAHIRSAKELIIFDPGNDKYTDTKQLGIEDAWMPDGQIQYDVDTNGIEITNVSRSRNRIHFADGGSVTWLGQRANSENWEWFSGEANQLVEVRA